MGQVSAKLRRLEGGYMYFCPGCDRAHVVRTDHPAGGNWTFDGNLEVPTFSPSVLVTYNGSDAGQGGAPPARCHSFVKRGQVEFLNDCTHALHGRTVPLPDLPPHLLDH